MFILHEVLFVIHIVAIQDGPKTHRDSNEGFFVDMADFFLH